MPYQEPRLKPPPRARNQAPVRRRPPAPAPAPDSSSSSDDEEIEATPFFKPKPRPSTKKADAPARSAEERAARNDALNTPAEEEAARAFLAEAAPWLVPGKVVKPPHLDENAPPTPPFTVPKPRLLVPPEDAEAGFESPEAFYGTAKVLPPEAPSPEDVAASINARAATPGSGWWWETDSAVLTCPGAGKRVLALHDRDSDPRACSVLCGNMGLGQHDVVCLRGPLSNSGKYRWWNAQDHQQIEHSLRGVLEFIKKRGPFQVLLGVGQAAQIVTGLSARGVCRTLGIDNLTNPTWKGVVPVHAVDDDLEAMNAVVKKLRGQKHALSIFWRSGWVDTVPALSVIGMGDSDRRDAALRVSRLFKHNTNAVHRGSTAVPAAARDDEQFSDLVDGFMVQPFLC